MEISDKIRQLLPDRYEIDAQNVQYFRVSNKIKLPDASRTPTVYDWLWRGPVVESYFIAIDTQIYMPKGDIAVLNIKLEENHFCFGLAAYWQGRVWGYSSIGDIGPEDHPITKNDWSWTIFQRILSAQDFKCLIGLNRAYHWVLLARS